MCIIYEDVFGVSSVSRPHQATRGYTLNLTWKMSLERSSAKPAVRSSVCEEYLIGRVDQLHHCFLPGSHSCDWENLGSASLNDNNWAIQEPQNGETCWMGCYTTLIQIQRYCCNLRCQKNGQKKDIKEGTGKRDSLD